MYELFIFLIILSILVVVHEWGHFYTAKKLGVKVEKFSVGFGKKLFSRMHDGTEFMISAVPLGGYVKMAGDERSQCTGSREEFYSHPVWHRALIVFMGPVVNFVFAYFCFYVIFVSGYPSLPATIKEVVDGSPAQVAGLLPGDSITSIDNEKIEKWAELQLKVFDSDGRTLQFTVQRGDETIVTDITPTQFEFEPEEAEGQEAESGTLKETPAEQVPEKYWAIGVKAGDLVFEKYGFGQSFVKAGEEMVRFTKLTFKGLSQVITGQVPAKKALAGPIGIFGVIKDAAREGFAYLIYITAVISASLAIFNLFPVPVLDGGHILLLAIEKVRGRPLSLKVEENLTKAGLSLLLCLFVFVLYNDIDRIGWLDNIKDFFQQEKNMVVK